MNELKDLIMQLSPREISAFREYLGQFKDTSKLVKLLNLLLTNRAQSAKALSVMIYSLPNQVLLYRLCNQLTSLVLAFRLSELKMNRQFDAFQLINDYLIFINLLMKEGRFKIALEQLNLAQEAAEVVKMDNVLDSIYDMKIRHSDKFELSDEILKDLVQKRS